MTYSTDKNIAANLETISAKRAKEVIELNRQGEKPISLQEGGKKPQEEKHSVDLAGGDINRFDKAKKKKKKKHNNNRNGEGHANGKNQHEG